jgi:anti-sigma factor ChrR (cupin superfamily)
MTEILLNTNKMEWEESLAYPRGTMVKVLRDEGDVRALLMKLPPGFHMNPHAHTTGEQHLILEGGYETSGWEFGPGTYHYLPARKLHGPFTSRNGAVVLVIWEK